MPTSVGCTPKVNGSPTNLTATITFYGYPDNTPPSNQISYAASDGNPTIHNVASGSGTYCDPTTFATETSDYKVIPIGSRVYEAIIKRYLILEDECAASGPSVGDGSNGCYGIWTDVWVGGSKTDASSAVVNCENSLTPGGTATIILNPPPNLPTAPPGPIFTAAPGNLYTCNGVTSKSGTF